MINETSYTLTWEDFKVGAMRKIGCTKRGKFFVYSIDNNSKKKICISFWRKLNFYYSLLLENWAFI